MRAYSAAPAVVAASVPSAAAAAPPLTPEASAVLSRAAGDASRRRHAHTTPLHAAAALLSGPAPLLRDACAAGLASPHPLRCRALDLCFAVALDRLPTSTEFQYHDATGGGFHGPPPLSNALSAALKRAYAHHRRIGGSGVEADDDHRVGVPHLVLAILDDPSVARVMREASFSSTAVKAAMLRSLSLSDPAAPDSGVYVNARLLHRRSSNRDDDVTRVVEVLKRGKKCNPVLVGDTVDVDAVVQEVITAIQRQRLGNARVISFHKEFGNELVDLEREELVARIKELAGAIRSELLQAPPAPQSAGVVVSLGDLQWLVEERRRAAFADREERRRETVLDTARAAVAEVARVLEQSGDGELRRRVWVIGTATCATYLKCQVYHPALEREWDIQAVPITPMPPPSPALGLSPRGILRSSVEVLSSAMAGATHRATSLGDACVDGYERELAQTASPDQAPMGQPPMTRWLQIGTAPSSALPPPVRTAAASGKVDTDLALGPASSRHASSACDTDEKTLVRRLTEAVSWQPEAASAVAKTILKAGLGEGRRRPIGAEAGKWVVFAGDDVAGKRRMAEALSEAVFGAGAVTVRLGTGDEPRRTALDGVAEAVRADPYRVVVLDDLDQADSVVHGSIVRAIDSGRLVDSHGRDVALGGAIFVVMSSWSSTTLPGHPMSSRGTAPLADSPWNNLELRVRRETPKRWPEQPLDGGRRRMRPRKGSSRGPIPLDLNLSMCDDVDHADDGDDSDSERSSDLTGEHEQEHARAAVKFSEQSTLPELIMNAVDGTVVFKPLSRSVVPAKLRDVAAAGGGWSVHVDAGGLDRLGGAAWTAAAGSASSTSSATSLEAWAGEVLCPSTRQLKRSLSSSDAGGGGVATLSRPPSPVDGIAWRKDSADVFPTSATVAVDGN